MTKLGRDKALGKSLLRPVKAYVKLQGTEFEYLPVRGREPTSLQFEWSAWYKARLHEYGNPKLTTFLFKPCCLNA